MEAGRAGQRPPKQVLQRGPGAASRSGQPFKWGKGTEGLRTEITTALPSLLNTHGVHPPSTTPPSCERYKHSANEVTKLSAKLRPSQSELIRSLKELKGWEEIFFLSVRNRVTGFPEETLRPYLQEL